MELFDVLDCTGRKTGKTVSREEAHRTGLWHGAFHCLVIYERDKRGYALFQMRSVKKRIAPGKFDVSAGGHYAAGEDAKTAGPREIREELGLDVNFSDLFPLGRRVFVYCFTPGATEYELQDVFLLQRNIDPRELLLQQEELDAALELGVEQGVRLFSGKIPSVEGSLFKTGVPAEGVSVSAEDFVPCLDNYYLKLLLISRRYFKGERGGLVI